MPGLPEGEDPEWLVRALRTHGWMSRLELLWLFSQAQCMRDVVEVGSWRGRSTQALLAGCPGLVYCVDHWKGSEDERGPGGPHSDVLTQDIYSQFIQNVQGYNNLRIMRGGSIEMSSQLTADMVFIDACHRYQDVIDDICAWKPRARRILAGHDWNMGNVQAAVKDTLGEVQVDDCIWWISTEVPKEIAA